MSKTYYVWDEENDSLLEEIDENGNVIVSYTNEPGPFGKVISQERDGVTSYYHYDGQGNTVALTDDNENTTDTYIYTAFGELVSSTGTTVNPFRYGGQYGYYTDVETNDIYIRARSYTPSLGRWLTRDPLKYSSTDESLYEFVRGNPLRFLDPLGNEAVAIQSRAAPPVAREVCCRFYGRTLIGGSNTSLPYNVQVTANPGESSLDACKRAAEGYWYPPTILSVDEYGCTNILNYGHYCGFNRRANPYDCEAKCPGSRENSGPHPIDDLDTACFNHDCCLGTRSSYLNPLWHRGCNRELCARLVSVDCSISPRPFECESFRLRAFLLTCGSLSGFPLP